MHQLIDNQQVVKDQKFIALKLLYFALTYQPKLILGLFLNSYIRKANL